MQTDTLSISQDPMGAAIRDFHLTGKARRLRVLSSMFEEDEMPVAHLFRTFKDMPRTEQRALEEAYGNVLDIGAGAGCHALELQQRGKSVKAIDISPLSCEVMEERGVKDVECTNVFNPAFIGQFDTILLLMNGTGIAGKLSNLPNLLNRLKQLMSKDGQILIDSSDLKYIYEDEDGAFDIDLNGPYYGEVDYQMVYRNVKGEPFDWLYTDPTMLKAVCEQCGLKCEIIEKGDHYDYLAKITLTI